MRSNHLRAGLMVAMLVGMAGTVACESHKDLDAPLIVSSTSPIADVPVPAGFNMIDDESTSQVVAGRRTFVDHMYKGSDDMLPVVRFYREQLPQKGWTAVDQSQMHEEVTLRFSKGDEECVVTVVPKKWYKKTRVRIQIHGANGK